MPHTARWLVRCGSCMCVFTLWVIQTMWPHFREWYTRAKSVNTAFVRLIWRSAKESEPVHIYGFKPALHIVCGAKGNGPVRVLSGSPRGKRWQGYMYVSAIWMKPSLAVSLRSFSPHQPSLLHALLLNSSVCETMPAAVSAYKWFSMCFVRVCEWERGRGR